MVIFVELLMLAVATANVIRTDTKAEEVQLLAEKVSNSSGTANDHMQLITEKVPDFSESIDNTTILKNSRLSRSNLHRGSEVDRLIEAHEWHNLDLQLEWDEHARQLAEDTLVGVADGECLLRTRCFKKVKSQTCNDYNHNKSFKCYSITIEETPYVAKQLSTDYLVRTSNILINHFSRNARYGCAVSAVRATAKVNCVYMITKSKRKEAVVLQAA